MMPGLRLGWKKDWTFLGGVVLALRALYAVMAYRITALGLATPLGESTYALISPFLRHEPFFRFFINPWFQWDTPSYLEVSLLGYNPNSSDVAYLPLYPLAIRATAVLTGGDHLFAALLISSLCFAIALILFYELTIEMVDLRAARWGVAALVAFPTAFFFLAGYTESLFLALVLGCWLLARHKHWVWAALLGALASLTRLQGVVLAPVLLWMMLVAQLEQPAREPGEQIRQVWGLLKQALHNRSLPGSYRLEWLAALAPALTFGLYQFWMSLAGLGNITTALDAYWKIETVPPWVGVALFWQRLVGMHFIYMDWVDLLLFVIVLAAALAGLRLLDPAFSLYVWATLAIYFMRGTPPHLLASYSRYFLVLFPLFILFGRFGCNRLRFVLLLVSFCLQLLLGWIFLLGSWVA